MESDSKHCKNTGEISGRDRLSELPDEVLLHILSLMPTLDAVRTVLLRRFGNLWYLVPSLKFKDGEILYAKELLADYVDKDTIDRNDLNKCFASYVRNVVLFHKRSTIDKFCIRINELHWLGNNSWRNRAMLDEIKTWIRYAIEKEVKELSLRFLCCRVDGCVLPRCVFTSQFLVQLKISGVRINDTSQVHMEALKSLSLSDFEMSNESFKKLLSGCPSLKEIDIQDQYGLDELCITAPSIEKLELHVNPCLLDCPNVKILNMFLYGKESPPKVVDISSLRELTVYSLRSFEHINELVKMFYTVEVFTLYLGIGDCSGCRGCDLSLELSPIVMPQLKIVTLHEHAVNCEALLRLVEFLLRNATSLEKIIIVVPKRYETAAVHDVEFEKKLSGFSRASSTARVVLGCKVY